VTAGRQALFVSTQELVVTLRFVILSFKPLSWKRAVLARSRKESPLKVHLESTGRAGIGAVLVGTAARSGLGYTSPVEQRGYCTTCRRTFSADKHTFFETIRSHRSVVTEALALLGERNSLRAVARLTGHSPNRILYWLDLAGRQAATVSADLIRHLHLTQVQIDELWTFVKKNKRTVNQMILLRSAICGCGARWRYPAACAS
jgi:hypothetical protein